MICCICPGRVVSTLTVLAVFLMAACETPRRGSKPATATGFEGAADALAAVTVSTTNGPVVGHPMRDTDSVVARLGSWSLRKSDVYDHLMKQEPDQVRAALAVMLSQRVVAKRAHELGVVVDDEELRRWFEGHRAQLVRRVALDYGTAVTVERYLQVTYGQSMDAYQRIVVDRERDFRLMARVVRFAQLTEDRVRLRLLSVPDRTEARRLRRKLDEGADFERLAEQASSHSSRERGGNIDPMWPSSLNRSLKAAVDGLDVGEISGVVDSRDEMGRRRFFLVQLLEKIPGQGADYAARRNEIEDGLRKRPLETAEFVMWQARINNQVELVPAVR